MARIHLICWDDDESREKAARIQTASHIVSRASLDMTGFREIRDAAPDVVVIDLDRRPSHGRQAATVLRGAKATRQIPLVFAGGEAEKIAQVRKVIPDGVFTPWSRIRSAVRTAIRLPGANPVVPPGPMEGYADTPLVKKLGIKSDSIVVLVGAPVTFDGTLGQLPADVLVRRQDRGRRDLTLWFVRTRRELDRRISKMAGKVEARAALWIVWPKKTSGLVTDVTQTIVRRTGLDAGLVDYKICAIDATWSGLKFARRK